MRRRRHLHRVVRLLVGLVEPHADERGRACEVRTTVAVVEALVRRRRRDTGRGTGRSTRHGCTAA